jgi:small subunit ribosomal protein S20
MIRVSRPALPAGTPWRQRGKKHVASHASALKAHRQSLKHREHNREFRSKLRSALKSIRASLDAKDAEAVKGQFRSTVSLIDKMAQKGIIHHNAAARYKSRIQARLAKIAAPAA